MKSVIISIIGIILVTCIMGCHVEQEDSDVKLTHSTSVDQRQWPSVVKLQPIGKGSCSASFIDHDVLLTAAHCLVKDLKATISDVRQQRNFISSSRNGVILDDNYIIIETEEEVEGLYQSNKQFSLRFYNSLGRPHKINILKFEIMSSRKIKLMIPGGEQLPNDLTSIKSRIELSPRAVRIYNKTAIDIFIHPEYEANSRGVESSDIAIIQFPSGTSPQYLNLSPTPPSVGTEVFLMGYGQTGFSFDKMEYKGTGGNLQMGENTISSVGKYITIRGAANNLNDDEGSVAGRGDSGGPMMLKSNSYIVGVVSGTGITNRTTCDRQKEECDGKSYYVNLHHYSIKGFLDDVFSSLSKNFW